MVKENLNKENLKKGIVYKIYSRNLDMGYMMEKKDLLV